MKFEEKDNQETKELNNNKEEVKNTILVQEQAPWEPFDDNIGEDSKRIPPKPERIEKMNKILKDLGVLFDGFDKWHLDGALNISLFKKEYIGNHKDVDLSIERKDLKELEAFLKEKDYALFLSQNEEIKDNGNKIMRRVSHVGIGNYEGHPMICAIKEDGEIDKSKDLNYVDLHIVDRDDNNLPLLDSGVNCPEEWTKSYPATKEGQQINLSHPAKVLYYKLNQGRNYDRTDIDRLLELNVVKENDIDEIKSIFEKEFIKYKEKAFILCEKISKDIKPEMSRDQIFEAIKRREEFKDKDEMDPSLNLFSEEIIKLKDKSPENIFNLAISLFAIDKKNQKKINELDKMKQDIVSKNKLSEIRNNINTL